VERGTLRGGTDCFPHQEVRQEFALSVLEHVLELALTPEPRDLVEGLAKDGLHERLADATLESAQMIHDVAT